MSESNIKRESKVNFEVVDGSRRRTIDRLFHGLCILTAAISVAVLAWLLYSVFSVGFERLSFGFLTSYANPDPALAGIYPTIIGTLWVCSICAIVTLPIGIATAVLLEEFKPRNRLVLGFFNLLQINISNLAGVPSVVYGLLGLTAFVTMFGMESRLEIGATYYDTFFSEGGISLSVPVDSIDTPETIPTKGMKAFKFPLDDQGQPILDYGNLIPVDVNVISFDDPFPETDEEIMVTILDDSTPGRNSDKAWYYLSVPFGRGVLAGALTLMLVILPVIIISTQEALRAVPSTLRDAARGLGATPWQVVWHVSLPAATPGIMTGSILAMSRVIGETAPILIITGVVMVTFVPGNLMDQFAVLPLQIYNWIVRPQPGFREIAAAGIIVLLGILLTFNAIAVFIRQKLQRPLS